MDGNVGDSVSCYVKFKKEVMRTNDVALKMWNMQDFIKMQQNLINLYLITIYSNPHVPTSMIPILMK